MGLLVLAIHSPTETLIVWTTFICARASKVVLWIFEVSHVVDICQLLNWFRPRSTFGRPWLTPACEFHFDSIPTRHFFIFLTFNSQSFVSASVREIAGSAWTAKKGCGNKCSLLFFDYGLFLPNRLLRDDEKKSSRLDPQFLLPGGAKLHHL